MESKIDANVPVDDKHDAKGPLTPLNGDAPDAPDAPDTAAPDPDLMFNCHRCNQSVPSADHHNPAGQYNPAVHGTSGPLKTSLPGNAWPIDQLVLNTTQELPEQFPFNLDYNAGNTLGVGM